MICKNKGCGREIDADSVYCKWCGTRQVREKRSKSAAHTPNARRLPSGSWMCRVRVGGQDISITRETKEEAVAEAMAIKYGLKAPEKSRATMTLAEAYARYIDAREGALSPSTVPGYLRLKRNTFQNLMPLKLGDITSEQIQREVSAMAKMGKSPKYIANAHGLLSSVLKEYNPGATYDVRLPAKKKPNLKKLEDVDIAGILAAFRDSPVELPVLMALWLGMRLSEILGAEFADIDGERLHICRAVVLDKNNEATVKDSAKSYAGDRWVDIPPYIMGLIRAEGRSSGRIVTLTGAAIYGRFVRRMKRAGLPRCSFHDLRHANAAVMVRLGVDSKYAQERNGWASDRMYKQIYAYIMSDQMAAISDQMNDYFGNKMATEKSKTTDSCGL